MFRSSSVPLRLRNLFSNGSQSEKSNAICSIILLPEELLALIVDHLWCLDLSNLRLTCKTISRPATHRLFSQLHISPKKANLAKIICVVDCPAILQEVISIILSTTEDPKKISKGISEESAALTPSYQRIIQSLSQFPKLREIVVQFGQIIDVDNNGYLTLVPKNQECIKARYKMLQSIFSALDNPHQPPPSMLHSLTVQNLPPFDYSTLNSNPNAKTVLSRLSSLRLHLLHDFSEYGSFFANLTSTFLSPTQTKNLLTSLSLSADVYWGYFPRYDIRSCGHFPNLKKLELGNYTFTHDWALEWILEHKGLEKVVFRDCAIVNYYYYYGMLDEDHNIPFTIPAEYEYDPEATGSWTYDGQWSRYFANIEEGLRHLREFRLEFGVWERGRGYRENDRDSTGLNKEKYVAFNMREGTWPWLSLEAFEWMAQWGEDWTVPIINRNMVKKDEDDAALERLMKVVKVRRSGR